MAQGWGRHRELIWEGSRAVGEDMVEALDPQPGQTVLELACGPGQTGLLAAGELGENGGLIQTDFSPEMVEQARETGGRLGVRNVEYRVLDAERMDLPDDSVDGVLCRFGYMLMADPAAALAETRRVLRAGGKLSFAVWGPPERNPWAAVPRMVFTDLGFAPPPDPGDPGIFAMGDPKRIDELVTGAGFAEPRIKEIPVYWPIFDTEAFRDFIMELAGPIKVLVESLSAEDGAAAWEEIDARIVGYFEEGKGIRGLCLNVLAG